MRVTATTLILLKRFGDTEATETLARGKNILMTAHNVGMTPGFFYSQNKLLMVPVVKTPIG